MKIKCLLGSVSLFAVIQMPLFAADPNYNPNLLMFVGEVASYVDQAGEIKAKGDAQPSEAAITDLKATATRGAKLFFKEQTPENKKELEQYLGTTLNQNPELKNYFVFLGNAFAAEAGVLIDSYKAKQKKIKSWGLVGGAVLGLALAGGYIYVKTTYFKQALSLKDAVIGAGAIGGGFAVGYGGSLLYAYKLPVDRMLSNARDFAAKYPHGEDFVQDITKSSGELKYQLSELDR